MLVVHGDLRLEAPAGGHLYFQEATPERLVLFCSDETTLWEGFRLLRAAYPGRFGLRLIRRLRNPLRQRVVLRLAENDLISWPAGKFPRILSLRGLLRVLRERG